MAWGEAWKELLYSGVAMWVLWGWELICTADRVTQARRRLLTAGQSTLNNIPHD